MSIKRHYYKTRAEWIELRGRLSKDNLCLGASELSTALEINKYRSPIQLFYNTLGIYNVKFESLRMSLGLKEESINKALYESYDPDEETFATNLKDDVKVNKVQLVNCILVNDDFPIIASSLDFQRPKNQPALVDSEMFSRGEIIPFAYPIDAKNTSKEYYKMWGKGSVPENYKCQLHGQMISMGVKYSELSVKVDSSEYHIIPVPFDEKYAEWMKPRLVDFYRNLVKSKPMADLLLEAKVNGNEEDEALYTSMLASLEPRLIGIDSEVEFLNDFYGSTVDTDLAPSDESRVLAYRYARASQLEKVSKEMKVDVKSKILSLLKGYENIKGEGYKITHRNRENSREYFSVKVDKAK